MGAKKTTAKKVPTTADSYVELAALLDVSRQSLNKWRKRKDAPKTRSNGKHSIKAWKAFMRAQGLKSDGYKNDGNDENDLLRGRKLKAEVELAELKLQSARGKYIPLETVREVWVEHISQARKTFENHLLNELPPVLAAMDDAIEIREKLQGVIDAVYAVLSNAKDIKGTEIAED